jgi:cysteinyl-tRNA synthetase
MPDYGKLSKQPLDEMMAGARVEVAPFKRDPMDFVLWKPSKPGEPAWPSPAGIATPGRPGWHIECSAMADRWLWTEARPHLSERGLAHPHQFDIHGGGIDLVFPHHENEIAQSRSAFHLPVMANFWVHNGFLQVEGRKMAKSEGNFITIRELLRDWPGEVLRFNMLRTHYRQPIDWTIRGLQESWRTLDEWYALSATTNVPERTNRELYPPFLDALRDDLNTPQAITVLHQLRNATVHDEGLTTLFEFVDSLRFLGFMNETLSSWDALKHSTRGIDASTVERLIDDRNAARKAKKFKEADFIRDELRANGIELEDHKDGTTTWKVSR